MKQVLTTIELLDMHLNENTVVPFFYQEILTSYRVAHTQPDVVSADAYSVWWFFVCETEFYAVHNSSFIFVGYIDTC